MGFGDTGGCCEAQILQCRKKMLLEPQGKSDRQRLLWKSKVARQVLYVSLKYRGWERKVDVQLPHTSSAPSFQEMFYLQI